MKKGKINKDNKMSNTFSMTEMPTDPIGGTPPPGSVQTVADLDVPKMSYSKRR
jgi:hypothetical protein